MRNKLQSLIFILLVIGFNQCANQTQPTGGPKDEEPPKLVSSIPRTGTTNFKGKQIELEFDEFIQANNPREQIIITPTLDGTFELKVKKHRATLLIEAEWAENTTYTINFRDAIQDLTEKNPAQNLKIAFSTGDLIDSLYIRGYIYDLHSLKAVADATVGLYKANDTLDVLNSKPYYFGKTNKQGKFEIDNIKSDHYKIYAIADKNKNLKADTRNEKYGFKSEVIHLIESIDSIHLPITGLDVRDLEMTGARASAPYFQLKFNKSIIDYDLISQDSTYIPWSNPLDDKQTIWIYNTGRVIDSLEINYLAIDSINNIAKGSFWLQFPESRRQGETLKFSKQIEPITKNLPIVEAEFNFNKPITKVLTDSLFLQLDSLTKIYFDTEIDFKWNKYKTQVKVKKVLEKNLFEQEKPKEETAEEAVQRANRKEEGPKNVFKPLLYIGKASFITVEKDSTKKETQELKFVQSEQTGSILVEINTNEQNYIIQLVSPKLELINEVRNQKKFEFKQIKPGTYKLRIIIDTNGNGKWDYGNILINEEPERILIYKNNEGKEDLILRANWELGPVVVEF
jgi:uncharacterized protein (DUF2141 family)